MTATTKEEPWTPTVEWLGWAEYFDARIGFREGDRSEEEVLARKRAEVDPRHRGESGHLGGERTSSVLPWSVSTDVPTKTPRQDNAVRRFVRDTDARAAEARDQLVVHGHVRHVNRNATRSNERAATRTMAEEQAAQQEAQEIIRVLAEHGVTR